jgi:hypothetical protein
MSFARGEGGTHSVEIEFLDEITNITIILGVIGVDGPRLIVRGSGGFQGLRRKLQLRRVFLPLSPSDMELLALTTSIDDDAHIVACVPRGLVPNLHADPDRLSG